MRSRIPLIISPEYKLIDSFIFQEFQVTEYLLDGTLHFIVKRLNDKAK